jgi:protein tyrosine phosphatase (PTP) superfamily phosphohydrolase (DUF442 family)
MRLSMKFAAICLFFALICSFVPAASAQNDPAAPAPDLPKYLEVTPFLGTGGQPTGAGLKTVAEKGYKAVVNLRTQGEKGVDLAAEEKQVKALGLEYYAVPLVGTAPEDRSAAEFLHVMDELKENKVFVHCASANRVGAVVMIKRVLKDGLTVDKAEEEANRIGLHTDILRNFAKEYIRKQGKPE